MAAVIKVSGSNITGDQYTVTASSSSSLSSSYTNHRLSPSTVIHAAPETVTQECDDAARRRSVYHNTQFFIWRTAGVFNVARFKYSLHSFSETTLYYPYTRNITSPFMSRGRLPVMIRAQCRRGELQLDCQMFKIRTNFEFWGKLKQYTMCNKTAESRPNQMHKTLTNTCVC